MSITNDKIFIMCTSSVMFLLLHKIIKEMDTKEKACDSLTESQRECKKYDNIFGSWYDHYYLKCWELNCVEDPDQEPPPWYYGLPDEEDYALIDKVQPKQKRPHKTTIRGLNS